MPESHSCQAAICSGPGTSRNTSRPAAAPRGCAVKDTLGLRKHLWEAGKGPHVWLGWPSLPTARRVATQTAPRRRQCRDSDSPAMTSVSRFRQPRDDSVVNLPQENIKRRPWEGTDLPGNPSPPEFPSSISPEKQRRHTGGNERSHRVQTARENTGDVRTPTRARGHRCPASPARQSPQGAQTGQGPRDLLTFPPLAPSHRYMLLTRRDRLSLLPSCTDDGRQ